MSKMYGICCAACNVPLNNEDDYSVPVVAIYIIFHVLLAITESKSAECMHCDAYKPMLYKMHLEFVNSPLSEKDQEKNIELCTKLNEYERINAFLNSSNNAARQTVQELEGKIKTLKDALETKEDIVKQLTDRMETLEVFNEYLTSNNNSAPDVSNGSQNKMESNKNMNENNKKQQPNKNNKFNNNNNKKQGKKGKGGGNNKNENVPDKEELPSPNINKEIPTDNENNSSDDDIEDGASAIKEQSASNEKQEGFAKSKVGNTVMIKNFKSSDLDKNIATANVIALAEKMGLSLTIHQIKEIHSFRENENFVTYIVEFHTKHMQDAFLGKRHILKKFPQTKFLFIL
ncbi:hypothetical protein DOY81_012421 [Sarcophaga bullata]|nr:hypothetical protein DOY81_012421 [Sarcophaga bullata]